MKVELTNHLLSKDFKSVDKVKKITQLYVNVYIIYKYVKYVYTYIKYVLRDIESKFI